MFVPRRNSIYRVLGIQSAVGIRRIPSYRRTIVDLGITLTCCIGEVRNLASSGRVFLLGVSSFAEQLFTYILGLYYKRVLGELGWETR